MARIAPPGETSSVVGKRVLVLSPHYDDEVLGCGGLVAQLSRAGGRVRTLFLTDGSGGDQVEAAARESYGRRRRREAEAAAEVLGVAELGHLDLPDGGLEQRLDVLIEALTAQLDEVAPDLVLAPSPLEVTTDHRAAFAALHGALAGIRSGHRLWRLVEELTVLLYEVNHPAYSDVLVDVSREREVLERAMACYPSQQERHDYLGAALGLRRYRTLSLPSEVELAEGYRRLLGPDFATYSLSQLIRHLGGVAELLEVREGPLVSVVVRTRDRPALLGEALKSLAESCYRRLEVVLVNDGGDEPRLPDAYPLPVVRVELPENRGRAQAANAGIEAATGDYVAFLDDDDLVAPEHYATLVDAMAAAEVEVVYTDAAVGVYELGGDAGWSLEERRLPYSRDFDPDLLVVDNYIPFNTLLIRRELFDEIGPFDDQFDFFEDWDFLIRLAQRAAFHHVARVTCEYRHFEGGGSAHVLAGGARQRSGFREEFLRVKAQLLDKHAQLLTPERLARVVDRLRAEQVEASEEVRRARLRMRELDEERAEREESFHRLNGEAVGLRRERQRLLDELGSSEELQREQQERLREREGRLAEQSSELERLYGEEKVLRTTVDDQTRHLERLYAEIERLGSLIARYEGSPAGRLQRLGRRLLGRDA